MNTTQILAKLTTKIFIAALILFSFTMMLQAAPVSADDHTVDARGAICGGLGAISGSDGCEPVEGEPTVDNTLKTVIDIISVIAAFIAVIMIIIGGIRFITSSGDGTSTANARNTIIYAVVGLIIIALAQLIVRFVVGRLDSSPPVDEETVSIVINMLTA